VVEAGPDPGARIVTTNRRHFAEHEGLVLL
jgi:hypothetical protein